MELNQATSAEWIGEEIKQIRPYPEGYTGRGIVMCAGGLKYLTNAYASIRLLRDKGCELPIEIWYLGEAEYEEEFMTIISEMNVKFRDAIKYMEDNPQYEQHLGGWELKPFAIIHSSFQDVLLLDADVFCDGDPAFVFDTDTYKNIGSIFTPDFNHTHVDRLYWKSMGIPYRDMPEFETGQVYVDKKICWRALMLTNKICEYGVRYFWNEDGGDSYGDKDCFRAAWIRTDTKFYMIPQDIHALTGTMVQHDVSGKKLFYHRNMRKLHLFINDSIRGFANEKKIFEYLKELKDRYNPYTLKMSEKDRTATSALEGSEWEYIRVNCDKRRITFLKDNMIGAGKASMESTYCIHENNLYLINENGGVTAKFDKWEEGWIGRWKDYERCYCLLVK